MIFLTVGSHEPFDRLVQGVDAWCAARGTGEQVFGQITARATYVPRNFRSVSTLLPEDFAMKFGQAACIVSHAGMGTIINALVAGKPIAVMPRRGHLKETRNDHQFATIQRLGERTGLLIAEDETALPAVLDEISGAGAARPGISRYADTKLLDALRNIIHDRDG